MDSDHIPSIATIEVRYDTKKRKKLFPRFIKPEAKNKVKEEAEKRYEEKNDRGGDFLERHFFHTAKIAPMIPLKTGQFLEGEKSDHFTPWKTTPRMRTC